MAIRIPIFSNYDCFNNHLIGCSLHFHAKMVQGSGEAGGMQASEACFSVVGVFTQGNALVMRLCDQPRHEGMSKPHQLHTTQNRTSLFYMSAHACPKSLSSRRHKRDSLQHPQVSTICFGLWELNTSVCECWCHKQQHPRALVWLQA